MQSQMGPPVKRYVVNGVEYSRLEDVPEEFRALLVDRDGNGVPDALEDAGDQGLVNVKTRTWQGRPDDAPPEIRRLISDMSGDGSMRPGVSVTSRVVRETPLSAEQDSGFRITSFLELKGWEPSDGTRGKLELRPGPQAVKAYWKTAAMAVVLSVGTLIWVGWKQEPFYVCLHSLLWALAGLWTVSPLWMRLRFLRDDLHNVVWVRGMRMIFPVRLRFPLGDSALTVHGVYHRRRPRTHGPDGWRWKLCVVAEGCKPFVAEIGFSLGRDRPSRLPEHVAAMCREIGSVFDAAVVAQIPGSGTQRIEPS